MPVLLILGAGSIMAQPVVCVTSATPPLVRSEGLTERVGDILLTCTGTPGNTINANISIGLNTNITNRASTASAISGIVFTIDSGTGPQPVLTLPLLVGANTLTYHGVNLPFSPQGAINLRFAGIRANATTIPLTGPIIASISINNAGLALTSSQLTVARTQRGLLVSYGSSLVCAQYGSPLPDTINFTNLVSGGTAFASTRATEGFADSFGPASAWANFNADSGQRILVQYSGFPNDARVFVPDVIAGSDALRPTSGGDFGLAASGGAYAPSPEGSLLLARVSGANSKGAGGTPVFLPGAVGSGPVTFDSVSEIPVVNGSAYAVYEVVDANPNSFEFATYPTFLGLLPDGSRNPTVASEQVFFAPSSSVGNATAGDPLPRFAAVTAPLDCGIVGDCDPTPPKLSVNPPSLNFTAQADSGFQGADVTITNSGGGTMSWLATMNYTSGAGWLSISPSKGVNSATLGTWAVPRNLAPGTYTGTLSISAGVFAGNIAIPVTLTITAPAAPAPTISSVLNAGSLLPEPVVPGSLTTIMGSGFSGKSTSATFNNLPALIVFSNSTQINLLVPDALSSQTSAQLTVTVDGVSSAPTTVSVAPFEPAIFTGGIVNQDGTVNSTASGTPPGSIISMWATGLSGNGVITGNIGGQDIPVPYYAGPAPGLPGVQQVNLMVPTGLAPGATQVYVCGAFAATSSAPSSKVCSIPTQLTIR